MLQCYITQMLSSFSVKCLKPTHINVCACKPVCMHASVCMWFILPWSWKILIPHLNLLSCCQPALGALAVITVACPFRCCLSQHLCSLCPLWLWLCYPECCSQSWNQRSHKVCCYTPISFTHSMCSLLNIRNCNVKNTVFISKMNRKNHIPVAMSSSVCVVPFVWNPNLVYYTHLLLWLKMAMFLTAREQSL